MAIEKLNIPKKNQGDELTADEFNLLPSKINELVDSGNNVISSIENIREDVEAAQNKADDMKKNLDEVNANIDDVRESVTNALRIAGEKVGWIEYAGGNITFFTEQGGQRIGSFSLSGTSYSINVESDTPTSFYILTSATSKKITLTPSTKAMELGGSPIEYIEDYTYTMDVDTGNGIYVERASGSCMNGESIVEDVRKYVSVGNNRIRFTITGLDSGQTKSVVFTAIVTTLTLSSEFTWNRAFVEGTAYAIDGLFFSGKLQKTLYVKVDDDDEQLYTVTFNSGTSYTTTAYSFDMTNHFPASGTGVHKFEIWMGGENVETQHYVYNVICVAAADANNVSLVCINDIAAKAVNYNTQTLFRYATYNATKVTFDITANDGNNDFVVVAGEELTVQTQTKIAYTTKLEIETEATEDFSLTVMVRAGEYTQEIMMGVDNSNSYAAVKGADFYTNSSLRSNGAADRQEIFNIAVGADKTSYAATWKGFAWSTDGWAMDSDDNKCLVVAAGNTVEVPDLKPLAASNANSLTLEFKYRCSNVADYDKPVMSFMSTDKYDAAETNGIILFPTKLTVLTSGNRQMVAQTVQLVEDQILHVVIVLQRGYGTTGRNLCHIYINGIRQCVFEYGGNTSFGNGYLKMGQESADFYFYMMRYYTGKVFEAGDAMTNFLNTLIDSKEYTREGVRKDNDIIDGTEVSYELCKAAGYNCMVIEMQDDVDIPSVENNVKVKSSVTFEYNDYPEWNVRIDNAPIEGQGTTSMRYYRWNVRWKLKSEALFTYADGTTDTKEGYIAGKGMHPKVSKITAKKNYASSMQGHKIGGTAMYDELYERLGLKSSLPSTSNRVAIYSYPFMGFQKYKDGTYKFIGLYTAGPDKGDKKTFGYDTKAYPSLLQIEGPNHAPLGTRFLHPWIDVTYSPSDETLMFGGQEAWDVSIAPWETSEDGTQEDWDNILNLLEQEWRPAYEIAYFCSPFLRSLSEVGMTLDEINADVDAFQSRMDVFGNRNNGVLSLYDSDYHLIYYRLKTKQYEILDGHDVRTYLDGYLDNMDNPSTGELIVARAAKFQSEAGNYWSIEDAEYHDNFCVLIGATDNHAKNTYPFKFKPLSEGGRWCWKQDDLDSILATDNNGQSTKSYSVEVGDVTADGTDIYQGSSSVFWTLIGSCFRTGCKTMMSRMVNALVSMAGELGIQGSTVHETVMNMFDYYFWARTAKYFPMLGYNTDSNWCYITPWVIDPNKTYNNVFPLTQALGTQYEAERQWVERRIVYVFSLYEIAAFTGSSDDGMGKLEFTPAKTFNFNITPAIDMYPSGNVGGGQNIKGERTLAGETCVIAATSDGQTTYYLKAIDWYTSLGDLCQLMLTSRGGDATVGASFAVSGKRLRALKVGDANPENVTFNASTLTVSGASLEEIDARNVVSLKNDVRLLSCPRLKKVLFQGTNVPTLLIPMGAKVEEVSYPSGLQTLFLHTLPLLTMEKMTIPDGSLTTINGIYYYECPNLSPFDILRSIFHAEGNSLQFLTMIWNTPVSGTAEDLDMLVVFTENSYDPATGEGYGSVEFNEENMLLVNSAQHPVLEGVINIDGYAYEDSVTSLREFFGSRLEINMKGYYIRFVDQYVLQILLNNGIGDGEGITYEQSEAVTDIKTWFRNNTNIVSFDELRYFTNVQTILSQAFENCKNLYSIDLNNVTRIKNQAFNNCLSLASVGDMSSITYLESRAFLNCSSLVSVNLTNKIKNLEYETFKGCSSLTSVGDLSAVTSIANDVFNGCSSLASVGDISSITYLKYKAFLNCSSLISVNLTNKIKNLEYETFKGCSSLASVGDLSAVTSIGNDAFYGCSSLVSVGDLSAVTSIGNYAFYGCSSLASVGDLSAVTSIGTRAFRNCSSLASVGDLSALTITYSDVFYDCSSLASVGDMSNVTEIGGNTFTNCSKLSSLNLTSKLIKINNSVFYNCTSLTSVGDLSGLTYLGEFAFYGCSLLEEINLSNKITSISPSTFSRCKRLKRVGDLSGVTTISKDAFYQCSNLIEVGNLSNVTGIGSNAFDSCSNLIQVNLTSKVKSIGYAAFYGCKSLTSVGDLSGVTSLDERVFWGCSSLQQVNLSSNITSIPKSAFSGCTSLSSVGDLSNVTSLNNSAFYNCPLTGIIEFDKLEKIDAQALQNTALTAIVIRTDKVCTISTGYNGHNFLKTCLVYVPDDLVDSYKATTGWSSYPDSIRPLSEYDG